MVKLKGLVLKYGCLATKNVSFKVHSENQTLSSALHWICIGLIFSQNMLGIVSYYLAETNKQTKIKSFLIQICNNKDE